MTTSETAPEPVKKPRFCVRKAWHDSGHGQPGSTFRMQLSPPVQHSKESGSWQHSTPAAHEDALHIASRVGQLAALHACDTRRCAEHRVVLRGDLRNVEFALAAAAADVRGAVLASSAALEGVGQLAALHACGTRKCAAHRVVLRGDLRTVELALAAAAAETSRYPRMAMKENTMM